MDQYGQFNNGGGGYGGFGGGYGGAEMAMPGGYGLVFRLLKMKIQQSKKIKTYFMMKR